jgi:hypothetical protein
MFACLLYTIRLSSSIRWSLPSDHFNSVKVQSTDLKLDHFFLLVIALFGAMKASRAEGVIHLEEVVVFLRLLFPWLGGLLGVGLGGHSVS